MNIKQRGRTIRETLAQMPDRDYAMVSIDNDTKGTTRGCFVEMPRDFAAQAIVDKTHRLATAEEIEQHAAEQRAKSEAIRREDMERRQPLNLTVYAGDKPRAERSEKR